MISAHVPNYASKPCLTPDDLEALRILYPPRCADGEMGYNTSAESSSCEFDLTIGDKILNNGYIIAPLWISPIVVLLIQCFRMLRRARTVALLVQCFQMLRRKALRARTEPTDREQEQGPLLELALIQGAAASAAGPNAADLQAAAALIQGAAASAQRPV